MVSYIGGHRIGFGGEGDWELLARVLAKEPSKAVFKILLCASVAPVSESMVVQHEGTQDKWWNAMYLGAFISSIRSLHTWIL